VGGAAGSAPCRDRYTGADDPGCSGKLIAGGRRTAGRSRPCRWVQREPFEAKGRRAEPFALGTRFVKERLWHIEIAFARRASGQLLVGDGRYLGLGLMAPIRRIEGVLAFAIADGLTDPARSVLLRFLALG
jgi:hypothetical protein